jgi:hypothetical protein
MAYISFTDSVGTTLLDNGLRSVAGGVASRFADWVPFQRPIGAAAVSLGTGARSMFTFRTDYGASFAMNDIPNTSMDRMLRLQAHLLGGGTVTVATEDPLNRTYTCCLAPEADVGLTLQDKTALLYSMTFTVINIAASPSAMLCTYDGPLFLWTVTNGVDNSTFARTGVATYNANS